MMNVPLEVIQDDQNTLRDVNYQPMIMIFDSKPRRPRTSRRTVKEKPSAVVSQSFAFIHVTRPDEVDEDARKLIRTHVMQDHRQRERRKSSSGLKVLPRASIKSQKSSRNNFPSQSILPFEIPLQPPTDGPAFVGFPVPMQPYMRRLIHQYSSSIMHIMDPKQPANPADSAWFPMVMTDPALFHVILSTSAIYIGLISGQEDSFPQHKHMLEAISLINARLQQIDAIGCVSDATITTILFMAKAEYAQRNYSSWGIHMNGLKRIVKVKGGMMMLPSLLRQKIYNAELTGCIETGSVPRFLFVDGSIIGPSIAHPSLAPGFQSLTQSHSLDRHLVSLLSEIEQYTYAVNIGMHSTMDLESIAVHIRYQLLSWIDQSFVNEQCSVIQQSLRFGAIIYIKTLLRKPSVRGIDYTVMLSSLRSHLLRFEPTHLTTGLLLWLLFIGGSASGSPCRAWYAAKLVDVTAQAGINTWDDAKLFLVRFWWVESIHEGPSQQLWDEVKTMRVNVP